MVWTEFWHGKETTDTKLNIFRTKGDVKNEMSPGEGQENYEL